MQALQGNINFKDSGFKVQNLPAFRADPMKEYAHRLQTRAHLEYLNDRKLFDVSKPEWAKATVDGEVVYAHEYEGCILTLRLKTADGKLNLTHNEDGTFDRHLMGTPGENTVWSITSSNNGLVSTQTLSIETTGITALALVIAALGFTVSLATGIAAADAAVAAAAVLADYFVGSIISASASGIGIALAVLAFIGIWIAYSVGREIIVNLAYENRSTTKTIMLTDHYVYNIGDNKLTSAKLPPLTSVPPFEFYSDVVVQVDNYSKIRGIGVSMKFQRDDGSFLIICIRNDIYKYPRYTIKAYPKGDTTSAQNAYDNCNGDFVPGDFTWGSDLVVKNTLDVAPFNNYNFSGIFSFNDKT